jgi:hypothetical protein
MHVQRTRPVTTLIILALLVAALLPVLPAQGQGPSEWLEMTFDDGAPANCDLVGGAEVAGGMLRLEPDSFAICRGAWEDVAFEIRVQFEPGGGLIVPYRAGAERGNILGLSLEHVFLQREEAGRVEELASPVIPLPPPDPEGWWLVRLVAIGPTHYVEINGEPVLEYTEPDPPLGPGSFNLENVSEGMVMVDYVMVGPPGDAGAPPRTGRAS